MTCARTHGVIDAPAQVRADLPGLADLGYERAAGIVRVPIKKTKGKKPADDQRTYNKPIRGIQGIGERANAPLIVRFKALRRVSLDPYRIGRSPPPPSYCSITRTTAPSERHTKRPTVTEKGSMSRPTKRKQLSTRDTSGSATSVGEVRDTLGGVQLAGDRRCAHAGVKSALVDPGFVALLLPDVHLVDQSKDVEGIRISILAVNFAVVNSAAAGNIAGPAWGMVSARCGPELVAGLLINGEQLDLSLWAAV